MPALAVADALRAEGAEVSFIGGHRAEATLVPAAGFALQQIAVEGVSRSHPLKALRALARSVLALPRSRSLLRSLKADAVLGGGGYVSAPVGVAALSLRLPIVLTEADSHLGLSNRLLAPFARRVCLAFPIPGREEPRYRVTGRPVPGAPADREAARRRFGIPPQAPCVLIFGGSLGARSINLAAVEAFASAPFHVLHISGARDYPELAERELPASYHLLEYLDVERFGEALDAADLAVARAGGSVFELAAHGVPAILVPYPHASADHQSTNARWMEQAGAAVTVTDAELRAAELSRQVGDLLGDRERLSAMARAASSLARPDAAAAVAGELLAAAAR